MITGHSAALDEGRAACCSGNQDPRLRLTVVYTTPEATLIALQTAGALAKSLRAQIELLAIEEVPFRVPLDEPPIPITFLNGALSALLTDAHLNVEAVNIRTWLCRDRRQCLQQILRERSLVVLAGRNVWWSKEKKLELWLTRHGHQVVFVDVSCPPRREEVDASRHLC
jgi:hypothetical protein